MGKIKTIIIIITAVSLLGGCILSGNQSKILTGTDGQVIAGRNQYDGYADGKESDSKALTAMAEAIESPTVTTEVKIDDNGNPVTTTTISLGGLILASKMDQIQTVMAKQNVPETSFAQGAKAVGGAVTGIISSPATMAIGLSWLWKDALLGAAAMAGGDNRNYVYKDIDGSFNETKVIGKGTATGPAMGGDTIMQPAPMGVE